MILYAYRNEESGLWFQMQIGLRVRVPRTLHVILVYVYKYTAFSSLVSACADTILTDIVDHGEWGVRLVSTREYEYMYNICCFPKDHRLRPLTRTKSL